MLKTFLSIIALILPIYVHANVIDSMVLRVQYDATLIEKMEDKEPFADNFILEIGNNTSKFYSSRYKRFAEMEDSVKALGDDYDMLWLLADNVPSNKSKYTIYKDYPKVGTLTYTTVLVFEYKYEENIPEIKWNLLEGDTIIAGYDCKKAEGALRGRTWTVWYAIDIPYDNGPWKLGGLPGLILYAKEAEGFFSFDCKGIEYGRNASITLDTKNKYQKCTPQKLQEMFTDYWKDQFNYTQVCFGMKPVDTSKLGLKVKPKSFKYCPIEFY